MKRLIFFCTALSAMQAQTGASFSDYAIPTAASAPLNITAGADGALWFTESGSGKIGRITTAGQVSEFALAAGSQPGGIAAGPDGALWFTDGGAIGRITTSGQVSRFALPSGTIAGSVAAGPDGALWFSAENAQIGRISTAGVLRFFKLAAGSSPSAITAGPDGALWFLDPGANKIGRITTVGVVSEFAPPTGHGFGSAISAGPDGALWYPSASEIARTTTSGSTRYFAPPTGDSNLEGIVTGPDGALWYTDSASNLIESVSTSGTFAFYFVPHQNSQPWGITSGPDQAVWFTERSVNRIGRLAVSASAGGPPPPAILAGGIVNSASFAAPVAPGSLVTIFTSPLSAQAAQFTSAPLVEALGGVSVTIGGLPAPMVSVAPSGAHPFVSAQVPFGVLQAGQSSATVPVVITVNDTSSSPVEASVAGSAPGIFTIPATGQGNAILVFIDPITNQPAIAAPPGASIGYPAAPIPRGSAGFFYATGLGALTPQVGDGSGSCPAASGACNANAPPTVLVGGMPAQVTFAGQAPGFPGVSQINIVIPINAPAGNDVSLQIISADGSFVSNAANITVQ